jgi:Holliday junction resolvase
MINLQPNCVAYRVNNTGIWDEGKKLFRKANTQKGLPDIFACIRGRFVGIEVKAKGDRESTDQKIVEQEIKAAKGVYLLTHSTDEFQIQLMTLLNG